MLLLSPERDIAKQFTFLIVVIVNFSVSVFYSMHRLISSLHPPFLTLDLSRNACGILVRALLWLSEYFGAFVMMFRTSSLILIKN